MEWPGATKIPRFDGADGPTVDCAMTKPSGSALVSALDFVREGRGALPCVAYMNLLRRRREAVRGGDGGGGDAGADIVVKEAVRGGDGGGGDAGMDIVVKLELKLEYMPSCPRLWSQSTHKGVGNMCGVAQQTVTKSAGGHVKDMCGTAQQAMTKSASGR